jgi:flagellar biosynthesis GTPase FlhF
MALAFEVESLDGVDEGLKGFYQEHNGKYRLAVEGIDPADELKEALRKEREESKAARQKAQELEAMKAEAEKARLTEKQEFKTLYEQTEAEKRALAEKFGEFENKIKQKEIEASSISLASELTRDTKRAELIRKEIAQFAKYGDSGVKYEIGGVEVDKAKVLETIKQNYPFLVDGVDSSGAGSRGSNGSQGTPKNPFKKGEHFNLTEQGKLMKENPELAVMLKSQA